MSRAAGDEEWGRTRGARPPLAPAAPLAWWAVTAVVLVAVVFGVVRAPGPLDDPQQGDQRAGFLIDVDEAREVSGLDLPGAPVGRQPVVVIFDRGAPEPDELRAFVEDIPDSAAVVVALSQGQVKSAPPRVREAGDFRGRIAEAVGMPRPKDGGPPVGYAVIDRDARVRYATLDPTYPEHGFEVDIIAGALK